MQRNGGDFLIAAALFLLLLLYSLPSLALQPVEAFVAGARQRNPDAIEARANLAQQQAQADSTLGRVLPGISARGSYTRNQYSSAIDIAPPGQPPQPITVVPSDQWDGSATVRVPLVDLAGFQRVSSAKTSAAEKQADAQRLALAPIVAGTFTERGTNAPGFSGHDWSYQAAVTATWSFDLTNIADIRAQEAAVDAARARELRTVLSSRDSIHREWNTIVAGIARSRSARAGLEAARHAAAQARERYRAGTITQLDLLQAQRDAFNAEVSRIQSDADLVNARAQLRLSTGHSLLSENAGNGMP